MKKYIFNLTYPNTQDPITVDKLMRSLLIPRKWRHYLRYEKKILINGKYLPLNFNINPNDKIQILLDHVESDQHPFLASGNLPEIVYEDRDVLVINKPAGQKTHPNLHETNTAVNDVATYLGTTPYIIHRLDMLTQGLLLMAKNPAVVPILNRQLTNKTLHREYLAWVSGNINLPDSGCINYPIGHDPNDQRKRMVRDDGQKAVTNYHVLKRTNDKTLLKLKLETGRTHQIRVHLATLGCPIIGDPLYNPEFNGEELQLIAYRLTFNKPFSFSKQTVYLPQFKNK